MEAKQLHGQSRTDTSKGMTKELRRSGKIPAVIYGHIQPTPVAVDAREFRTTFKRVTENTIIRLDLPEGAHEVLVKDYQRNELSGEILHIDFYEFKQGVALRTRVPIKLEGIPIGVREAGGVLETQILYLNVECLPKDLPEIITADVSGLQISHSLKVGDLVLPEGVKSLQPGDLVICNVAHKMAEEVVAAPVVEEVAVEEGAEKAEGAEEEPKEKEAEE
jgi:large subunit ribosomal protein L25